MDYAAWLQRAVEFTEALRRLPVEPKFDRLWREHATAKHG
jgi:hypothetical protein